MRQVTETVYTFDELNDKAKGRARDWWREHVFSDSNDWDCTYEDAATIADILGIDLRTRAVTLMGGGTRSEPCIYFSVFCSQGDGACFEGTYRYKPGSVKAIKAHAPQDKELHAIAETLQSIQRKAFYRISASAKHRGHYSMDIDVDSYHAGKFDADGIRQCLRDFADWIYSQLRKEYEYQNADEQVDGSLRANAYEFDENGNLA
jgi:hypothetical protein